MNKLMIVDDALIMRMKIREIAQKAGWTVIVEATNGEDALKLYKEHLPDLVTMDMVMPIMDGMEALKSIREFNPQANVVMVSAVDQKEKLVQCISLGAIDFIVKPFDSVRLQEFFTRYKK